MLEGHSLVLNSLKDLTSEADLRIHLILFDIKNGESLFTCNTGNYSLCIKFLCLRNDHSAASRGIVCVSDIDGNTCKSYGEDRVLMKNSRTHIGKLTKLSVGDGIDGARILYKTGVCHKESGYVCPVFIDGRRHGTGNDRACDITSAAGKGLDSTVWHRAVEAGDDCSFMAGKSVGKDDVCLFRIKGTVIVELDHLCRIKEVVSEKLCHDLTVKVLAAGRRIVATCVIHESTLDLFEILGKVKIDAKVCDDGIISFLNKAEFLREILSLGSKAIALVKHIGYLDIVCKALAGS